MASKGFESWPFCFVFIANNNKMTIVRALNNNISIDILLLFAMETKQKCQLSERLEAIVFVFFKYSYRLFMVLKPPDTQKYWKNLKKNKKKRSTLPAGLWAPVCLVPIRNNQFSLICNCRPARQPCGQACKQACKQAGVQTGLQAGLQTGLQASLQAGLLNYWLIINYLLVSY